MHRSILEVTFGILLLGPLASPLQAKESTDTLKSYEVPICSSPGINCSTFPSPNYFGSHGNVSVSLNHRANDEDRYSISFIVRIRNDTECRLMVPHISIKHGDNIMALDPGHFWVEPRDSRESVVKEFTMDREASRRLESAVLKYTLALSDCED